ncbi:hypothetical protein CPB85DRAFT_1249754 [Mucidula mucida]|nr:hypothetical protein CPB85DRAFT_1249754 [Mucidula mucida]
MILCARQWTQTFCHCRRSFTTLTREVHLMTSDAISHRDLKASLDKYGEVSTLWHGARVSIVEFRRKDGADKLTAERPFTVGDVTITPIPPSFAPEVIRLPKNKAPELDPDAPKSRELRLENVPVSYGANPEMVLNLLKPFDVVSVEMLSFNQAKFFRPWAFALFATQEGADRALAAMYSDTGIGFFYHKIYGKYTQSGEITRDERWIKAVA